ncbi:hypothetical protein FF1_013998 [Malus domestica]
MASLAQQFTGLRCLPFSTSRLSKPSILPKQNKMPSLLPIFSATVISNAQTKEPLKLKEIFEDAHEQGCIDLDEMSTQHLGKQRSRVMYKSPSHLRE